MCDIMHLIASRFNYGILFDVSLFIIKKRIIIYFTTLLHANALSKGLMNEWRVSHVLSVFIV